MTTLPSCPCESGRAYRLCCQPYVEMQRSAPTAEALMRSRYTAFVLKDEGYLRHSWHPEYCPAVIHLKDDIRWLGLRIVMTSAGQLTDNEGVVEFVARYKTDGRATRIHEASRFTRLEGRWVYLDGKYPDQKADKTR